VNNLQQSTLEREIELTLDIKKVRRLKLKATEKYERIAFGRLEYILTAWRDEIKKWHTE
jgi:hypothetical protein